MISHSRILGMLMQTHLNKIYIEVRRHDSSCQSMCTRKHPKVIQYSGSVGRPRVCHIQRSCGYSLRPTLKIEELRLIIKIIRSVDPDIIVTVDNCYGAHAVRCVPAISCQHRVAGNDAELVVHCDAQVSSRRPWSLGMWEQMLSWDPS